MLAAGLNFFAFDVIGSLAFGRPFGMVSAGKDVAPVSTPASTSGAASTGKVEHLPAIEILNRRGEYSATMGCIPPLLRPLAKKLPWFSRGLESVRKLAGIAIAAVGTRMELEESGGGADSRDLLSKLMKGKDENGNPMGREELTAEALTQLIAGEFGMPERTLGTVVSPLTRLPRLGHDLELFLRHPLLPQQQPSGCDQTLIGTRPCRRD